MSALTIAMLEARKDARQIAQFSNDENSAERVDANVQAALDDAGDYIWDALGNRFDVPIADPDGKLLRVWADLAMYFLAMRGRIEEPMDLKEAREKCDRALENYGRAEGVYPPSSGRNTLKPFGTIGTGDDVEEDEEE
jgi:phage gp36-like protein